MAKFHTLKVADVRRETPDCVSVAFEIPDELKSEYSYIQGQYLTLKVQRNGEEQRRSYSLCSSPVTDSEYRIAAKEVPGGAVSPWLNKEVKVGDEMEVMTPMGNFYSPVDAGNAKKYILFAGGSGITPVFGILKTVLAVEPNSSVTLIYANRDEQSIVFKSQLDELAVAYSDRLSVHHVMDKNLGGDELHTGVITVEKAHGLLDAYADTSTADEVFICGPAPMMANIRTALEAQGVTKEKIHIEYFTAVLEDIAQAEQKTEVIAEGSTGPVDAAMTVIMDGEEFEFTLNTDGPVILDAAMNAGVDAPFSCKGAVCCTCKAKVMEGKVKMDQNYALSDGEVEEGYVLTCQSHPLTEKVVVDYDEAY